MLLYVCCFAESLTKGHVDDKCDCEWTTVKVGLLWMWKREGNYSIIVHAFTLPAHPVVNAPLQSKSKDRIKHHMFWPTHFGLYLMVWWSKHALWTFLWCAALITEELFQGIPLHASNDCNELEAAARHWDLLLQGSLEVMTWCYRLHHKL